MSKIIVNHRARKIVLDHYCSRSRHDRYEHIFIALSFLFKDLGLVAYDEPYPDFRISKHAHLFHI